MREQRLTLTGYTVLLRDVDGAVETILTLVSVLAGLTLGEDWSTGALVVVFDVLAA